MSVIYIWLIHSSYVLVSLYMFSVIFFLHIVAKCTIFFYNTGFFLSLFHIHLNGVWHFWSLSEGDSFLFCCMQLYCLEKCAWQSFKLVDCSDSIFILLVLPQRCLRSLMLYPKLTIPLAAIYHAAVCLHSFLPVALSAYQNPEPQNCMFWPTLLINVSCFMKIFLWGVKFSSKAATAHSYVFFSHGRLGKICCTGSPMQCSNVILFILSSASVNRLAI